jgi:hypothetical protein
MRYIKVSGNLMDYLAFLQESIKMIRVDVSQAKNLQIRLILWKTVLMKNI